MHNAAFASVRASVGSITGALVKEIRHEIPETTMRLSTCGSATALLLCSLLPVCLALQLHRPVALSDPTRTRSKENATRAATTRVLDQADFSDLLDATLLPDYWNTANPELLSRIRTNGEIPEQLVKVTDRRHRFPVFATVCSLAFLVTIVAIIVICTQ